MWTTWTLSASKRGLEVHDAADYPREPAYLVMARLLLAQDRPDEALRLLDRLNEAAVGQRRVGSLIEIQAVRALALTSCGAESAAVAAFDGAFAHAQPEGYIRVFADEGPPMEASSAAMSLHGEHVTPGRQMPPSGS